MNNPLESGLNRLARAGWQEANSQAEAARERAAAQAQAQATPSKEEQDRAWNERLQRGRKMAIAKVDAVTRSNLARKEAEKEEFNAEIRLLGKVIAAELAPVLREAILAGFAQIKDGQPLNGEQSR
jgi:hypothetical protein